MSGRSYPALKGRVEEAIDDLHEAADHVRITASQKLARYTALGEERSLSQARTFADIARGLDLAASMLAEDVLGSAGSRAKGNGDGGT